MTEQNNKIIEKLSKQKCDNKNLTYKQVQPLSKATISRGDRKSTHVLHSVNTFGINKYFFIQSKS